MTNTRYTEFRRSLAGRILVLDGSIGVPLQRLHLSESEYRGHRFLTHPEPLAGDVDILNLTAEEHVRHIHRQYIEAGADIIETNTFNANALSQAEYGMSERVRQINLAAVRLARDEVERYALLYGRTRFVAGSMGPTPFSVSLPADSIRKSLKPVTFKALADAAYEQAGALIDGGCDLLLLETAYDALNIKAQLCGIRRATDKRQSDIPVILSMTVSDTTGRLLSGHAPDDILRTVEGFGLDAIGFNCVTGTAALQRIFRQFAAISTYPTIFYPNAGLPDEKGRYSHTAEMFSSSMAPLMQDGLINIAGGCCGTDASHISTIATLADEWQPRRIDRSIRSHPDNR